MYFYTDHFIDFISYTHTVAVVFVHSIFFLGFDTLKLSEEDRPVMIFNTISDLKKKIERTDVLHKGTLRFLSPERQLTSSGTNDVKDKVQDCQRH